MNKPSSPDQSQISLFDDNATSHQIAGEGAEIVIQDIPLQDGRLIYVPRWLQQQQVLPDTGVLFEQLQREVYWEQSDITLYGKTMKIPRLNAWYGDPGCGYIYSGKYFEPLSWLSVLLDIKQAAEATLAPYLQQTILNSALVNCYRHGQDSVAWHSDDEPELGSNPPVVSISLGQERNFQLRHRVHKHEKYQLSLQDGDLLMMCGQTQHHWHHQIPKTSKTIGARINITYRKIVVHP